MSVLYLVTSGAPAAAGLPGLVTSCQSAGWQITVFATPYGIRFTDPGELRRLTGTPVRSEFRLPGTGTPVPPPDAMPAWPEVVAALGAPA